MEEIFLIAPKLIQSTKHIYLKSIVRPAAKLHLTVLVIEGEPGDVDLAGGHEDARGDVCTTTTARHHHVCWISSIKSFTCTENEIINFI